jgi:Permuted papain-like amidase enzyme, YaeF/YiiX, C92 family
MRPGMRSGKSGRPAGGGTVRRGFRRRTSLACLAVMALALAGGTPGFPERPLRAFGQVRLNAAELEPGDLLFRRGRSLVSRAVLAADGQGEFSHVGLVSVRNGRVWVLHATPPEEPGVAGGVLAEPLASFLAPEKASAAAVYRTRDRQAAPAAERAAWRFIAGHLPFDDDFDLSSPDRLYCTELVWKAYREAGVDLETGVTGPRGRYLLPGRLARSPQLTQVRVFREEVLTR